MKIQKVVQERGHVKLQQKDDFSFLTSSLAFYAF